jgi:hypothetical protein
MSIFRLKIVPADGIRPPFSENGDLGTSPFLSSSQPKVISLRGLTVQRRQRTRKRRQGNLSVSKIAHPEPKLAMLAIKN